MFPFGWGLRGMGNPFQKIDGQPVTTLSGWILTFAVPLLSGVVWSQSAAIERLSQRQVDEQSSLVTALSALDRQIEDHGRDDRARDATVAQLQLEIAKLHAADEQAHVEMNALSDRLESARNERQTGMQALGARLDQGREERRDNVARLQHEIDELRSALGFVDGDTKSSHQR